MPGYRLLPGLDRLDHALGRHADQAVLVAGQGLQPREALLGAHALEHSQASRRTKSSLLDSSARTAGSATGPIVANALAAWSLS